MRENTPEEIYSTFAEEIAAKKKQFQETCTELSELAQAILGLTRAIRDETDERIRALLEKKMEELKGSVPQLKATIKQLSVEIGTLKAAGQSITDSTIDSPKN